MLQVRINGDLEVRIRSLAKDTQTKPDQFAIEIIETWLVEHRSARRKINPQYGADRNPPPELYAA